QLNEVSEKLDKARKVFSKIHAETKELQDLKRNADKLSESVSSNKEELKKIETDIAEQDLTLTERKDELNKLLSRIDLYSRVDEYSECGHFEMPEYLYETSLRFTEEIKKVRENQKELIKSKAAIESAHGVMIVPDKVQNRRIIDGQIKLMLTAFNIDCDLLIGKVRPSNYARILERIEKLANTLERSAAMLHCGINLDYVKLKYEECRLQYQYVLKKKEEQEEQRLIKEQIREEQRAVKEYERALAQAEKEERMYREMLDRAKKELSQSSEEDRLVAEQKIADLERQLSEALEKEERAKSMAEQTRKGHVYVISNIGSFGEDVYKIGLTRRLEPMDRVKELGDASVPFAFDVHAMIYVEDAPALESALHREFSSRRVNAVNLRKEFFRTKLSDIRNAVQGIVGDQVEFKTTILAEEYFETLRLQQEVAA
ncbi:MAG: DUF4041 domain-containing protein, partial [Kangiellaceae bacterium]|nr:DUF4041 domain-containing protein [Kangiellaceae bacterium]